MNKTVYLAEQLIARRSITPHDAGCQQLLSERLAPLGFACETLASGPADFRVTNLWAIRRSARTHAPTLVLAGHTHGGQLCVPGVGALVTNCDLDTGRPVLDVVA